MSYTFAYAVATRYVHMEVGNKLHIGPIRLDRISCLLSMGVFFCYVHQLYGIQLLCFRIRPCLIKEAKKRSIDSKH